MKKLILLVFLSFSYAGKMPYEVSDDSLSFAQLYLSYEYERNDDIRLYYKYKDKILSKKLDRTLSRLVIGALHFWGYADLYVSFPLRKKRQVGDLTYSYSSGVETGLKIYPFRLNNNTIRPFFGIAFNFKSYYTELNGIRGAENKKIDYPIQAGLTYLLNPLILSLGVKKSSLKDEYYVDRKEKRKVYLGGTSIFASLSFAYDTTKNGSYNIIDSNFYPYIGLGPSSSWLVSGNGNYLLKNYPYLAKNVNSSVYPEFSLGFEFRDDFGRNIFNLSYRKIKSSLKGYGTKAEYKRTSFALEYMHTLFNYQGFIPYIGPSLAFDKLNFKLIDKQKLIVNKSKNKVFFGINTGWDIIPKKGANWFLRTNLRYYKSISLDLGKGRNVNFPNFEFNFIQFIYRFNI